jgi:hypothetical protein
MKSGTWDLLYGGGGFSHDHVERLGIRFSFAVYLDSVYQRTEAAYISLGISGVNPDSSTSLHDNRRPMALLYLQERRLKVMCRDVKVKPRKSGSAADGRGLLAAWIYRKMGKFSGIRSCGLPMVMGRTIVLSML